MGHGIAQVSASAGYRVDLIDATLELAQQGLARVQENLDDGVRRDKVSPDMRDHTVARITPGADISVAEDADLLIEAVPEKSDLKQAVYAEADRVLPPDSLLASNTSSLSITDLQNLTSHPERFIGLHFFNPVHINRLVEVVHGKATSESTLRIAKEYVRKLDKDAIVVRDSPGFATSRLGVLLGLEAMRMLEEGVASAEDIDKALELGYRHPMGPLKVTDLVGLDVRLDIARYLHEKLGAEHFRPPKILERMVKEGKLGKKSGQGFYKWT